MTDGPVSDQLAHLAHVVHANTDGQALPAGEAGDAACAAIILAAALGRAVELGVPHEGIETIFANVLQLDEAMQKANAAAEANGPEEQLEVWFSACGDSVLERTTESTQPRELFALVYDFAAGTALGTGLSLDDAAAILKRCSQQLAQAGVAQPAPVAPPAAPRRWDAPT